MTNTHINVGGHKITTNKVGQVHTLPISSSAVSSTSYKLEYVVTNSVCIISAYLDRIVPMSFTAIVTGLPKPKISTITQGFPNPSAPGSPALARIQISGSSGQLLISNGASSNVSIYLTMSYPVADDWVES